ncbi:hypothetical protein AB0A60_32535 [Streptomyces sp. NPDC046275]|uniref:hypothetical protein n=1 Tax=Streptomyces sp. NPDC046275 TaxID=3157201 RepID=UPI0033CAD056
MGILGRRRASGGTGSIPAQAEPTVWPGQGNRIDEVAKAAGVGVIRVRCHTTTWDYLQEQAKEHSGKRLRRSVAFRPPTGDEIVASADGIVTVPLGGASLAALFDWCFEAQSVLATDLEKGVGRQVGRAISEALDNLATVRGQGDPSAVIWLDDQIAAAAPASPQS